MHQFTIKEIDSAIHGLLEIADLHLEGCSYDSWIGADFDEMCEDTVVGMRLRFCRALKDRLYDAGISNYYPEGKGAEVFRTKSELEDIEEAGQGEPGYVRLAAMIAAKKVAA